MVDKAIVVESKRRKLKEKKRKFNPPSLRPAAIALVTPTSRDINPALPTQPPNNNNKPSSSSTSSNNTIIPKLHALITEHLTNKHLTTPK